MVELYEGAFGRIRTEVYGSNFSANTLPKSSVRFGMAPIPVPDTSHGTGICTYPTEHILVLGTMVVVYHAPPWADFPWLNKCRCQNGRCRKVSPRAFRRHVARYRHPLVFVSFCFFCFSESSGGWVKIKLKLPHFHVSDACRVSI